MNRQITIGIDGNEANVLNRVGSNNYAFHILRQLHQLKAEAHFIIFLKSAPVVDMPKESDNWHYRVLTPKRLWTQWRLPLDLYWNWKSQHIDVFFSPGHYAPRKSPIPTVVTILDVSFLTHPSLFLKTKRGAAQLASWTEYSVRNAKQLITISQFTKRDIVKHYGIEAHTITVAYPGIDRQFFYPQPRKQQDIIRQKYRLREDFILYVGTLQPRKNLIRLLKAYETLPSKYKQVQLVIAGQKGWLYENFEAELKASKKMAQVKLLDYVDTHDLPALYSAASTSVLVGLYEGFGIPPAESLSCGTIPVVSHTSSLPEVVGQAGILVDPYSITEIRHGLLASASKKQVRLKLAEKQLVQFDWQKSATIIYKVLYDVATQR